MKCSTCARCVGGLVCIQRWVKKGMLAVQSLCFLYNTQHALCFFFVNFNPVLHQECVFMGNWPKVGDIRLILSRKRVLHK